MFYMILCFTYTSYKFVCFCSFI